MGSHGQKTGRQKKRRPSRAKGSVKNLLKKFDLNTVMPNIFSTCPHCGAVFKPWEMHGEQLDRRCPACEQQIKAADYDAKALKLLHQVEELDAVIEQEIPVFNKAMRIWGFFDYSVLRWFKRFVEKFLYDDLHRLSQLRQERGSLKRAIGGVANDRYYTGEWFQQTHNLLKFTSDNGKEVAAWPYYTELGEWHISINGAGAQGMICEMEVFNKLLSEVVNPESPLYRARIAPNLYLPREVNTYHDRGRFWDQVDMVLFTTKAAFVIEVKGHATSVVSKAPFDTIYSSKSKSAKEFIEDEALSKRDWDTSLSSALSQNSSHVVSFNRLCTAYHYDLIFEQCVFVNPHSFYSDAKEFIDNVNVSAVINDKALFLEPIYRVLELGYDILSQDQLDTLADSYIEKYADLYQRKWHAHIARIKELQERESA